MFDNDDESWELEVNSEECMHLEEESLEVKSDADDCEPMGMVEGKENDEKTENNQNHIKDSEIII